MRGVLVALLSGLAAGCGLVSGLDDLNICASCDAGSPDSSTDAGGLDGALVVDASDAEAGGWSVTSVTGLALWLNASVGVITGTSQTSVAAWADQSGNHNDASQAIAGRQPTLNTSSINGLPAIHFAANVTGSTGNQLIVADSTSLQWGTGGYYIAVVAKFDNKPTDGIVAALGAFYVKSTSSTTVAVALTGNVGGWGGNGASAGFEAVVGTNLAMTPGPYNDGAPRLYACRRVGTTLTPRLNGTPGTALPIPSIDVSAAGKRVEIGAFGDAANARLDGDIAEIIAVKDPSDADVADIEAYLMKRYGP